MLYKRQIELLYIIAKLKNAGRVKAQKIEFLACINNLEPSYEFIPYNYGPYSLTLQNDLDYLHREDYLDFYNSQYFLKTESIPALSPQRKIELDEIVAEYGHLNSRELMSIIYQRYPHYAVNSLRANDLLSVGEYLKVQSQSPRDSTPKLFTIGYEGKSLERYLSQLFNNGVKLLVDVRASSYSMKKEFIGSRLASGCKLLKIDYIHLPELGIPNQYRKEIPDKTSLFQYYQDELLTERTKEIGLVAGFLQQHKRIALTCFEALHSDCHRHYLADTISDYLDKVIPVEHLC